MNRVDDINATLRSLDPADRHVDPANVRARADLEAIVATDPVAAGESSWPHTAIAARPRRTARTIRRAVLVCGAVTAVATGIVVLPALTGGGDEAFATWTAVPAQVSAHQRPDAAANCRKNLEGVGDNGYADDLANAQIAIAESRGVWTTVVFTGADGFSAMCVSDDSQHLFDEGIIGSIGVATDYTDVKPRELWATDLGVGSMSGRDISLAAGHVGSDIVEVVYSSPARGDVAATVSHGRFALWLPGDELRDAPSRGVEVEVTYRDGTTGSSVLSLQ